MTPGRAGLAVAIALAGAASVRPIAQGGPPQQAPQAFRSGADSIVVDVSVRRGNTPVIGLTAADFEVRDNGVVQQVETVDISAVPIDLSVVVDVSGNPDRPWIETPRTAREVRAAFEPELRNVTALLREGDRVRLFAVDTYVQQVWPLQPVGHASVIDRLAFDGHATLYDTLATALLQPVAPERRHVIVAATRGLDAGSLLTAAGVRAIAERSDAQLHLVMREVEADVEAGVRMFQCACMSLCRPTHRFIAPVRRRLFNAIPQAGCPATLADTPRVLLPDGVQLRSAAEATGGGLHLSELVRAVTLHGTFERAFEHFRQSYVLRYTLRGVAREGWHRITVTVPKDKSLRIRARPGYGIDAAPPGAGAARPLPSNAGELRGLDDLVAAYGQGAFEPAAGFIARHPDPGRLIDEFDRGGNPWPASPRREAVFALELAEAAIYSPRPDDRERAVRVLERFGWLIQPAFEPGEFERAWLAAELAMLQGSIQPRLALSFVDRALERFPDDGRFHLARAVVNDQLRHTAPPRPAFGAPRPAAGPAPPSIEMVIEHYERAAAFPAVRGEARVRLGWLRARLGRHEEALGDFNAAAAGIDRSDRQLLYLNELLRGQALATLGRHADAASAFRRALAIGSSAQSARVGLMNALLATGDRAEAEQLAEAIQSAPREAFDPWWLIAQGGYRQYPQLLTDLRRMIR
jgi:tetratricopeptide (TPR) repeat protein